MDLCTICLVILFGIISLSKQEQVFSEKNCSFENCVTGKEFCNTLSFKNHCERCDLIPDYCQYPDKQEQCQLMRCKDQEITEIEKRFNDEMANKTREITYLKSKLENQSRKKEEKQRELTRRNNSAILVQKNLDKALDKIADLEYRKRTSEVKLHTTEQQLESERGKEKYYVIAIIILDSIIFFWIICACVIYKSPIKKAITRRLLVFPSKEELSPLVIQKPNVDIPNMDEEMSCEPKIEKKETVELEDIQIHNRNEIAHQTTVKQPPTLPSYPNPLFETSTPPSQPSATVPTAPPMYEEPPQLPNETRQSCHQDTPAHDQNKSESVCQTINCQTYIAGHSTTYYNSKVGANFSGCSLASTPFSINQNTPNISKTDSTETTCNFQIQEQPHAREREARMPLTREEHREPIQESDEHQ